LVEHLEKPRAASVHSESIYWLHARLQSNRHFSVRDFGVDFLVHNSSPREWQGLMKTARFRRMAQPGSAALVLLTLLCASVPRTASAGCDHLVQSRFDQFPEINRLDELVIAGTFVNPDGFSRSPFDHSAPYRSSPCSGLSCSSRFPLPVSTASIVTDGSQQWGTLGVPFAVESKSLSRDPRDESRPYPSGEIPSIFHPPRV
jgi:hypothetical protein